MARTAVEEIEDESDDFQGFSVQSMALGAAILNAKFRRLGITKVYIGILGQGEYTIEANPIPADTEKVALLYCHEGLWIAIYAQKGDALVMVYDGLKPYPDSAELPRHRRMDTWRSTLPGLLEVDPWFGSGVIIYDGGIDSTVREWLGVMSLAWVEFRMHDWPISLTRHTDSEGVSDYWDPFTADDTDMAPVYSGSDTTWEDVIMGRVKGVAMSGEFATSSVSIRD